MTAVGYTGGGGGISGVTSVDGETGVVVLTDDYAPIVHLHTGSYSATGHNHNEYAITGHDHTQYAITGHDHDTLYYTENEVESILTGYAVTGHGHSQYANSIHAHSDYSITGHNHTGTYAPVAHASTHEDGGSDEISLLRAQISDLNVLVAALVDSGNSLLSAGGIETLSRFGQNEFDGVSGRLWISYFTAPMDLPDLANLAMASAGGSGVDITLARIALFTSAPDGSLTLVARTDNDVTIGSGSYTTYDRLLSTAGGFPATYSPVGGGRYAMGFLQVAATPCKITGSFIVDGGTAPVSSRYIDGQPDIANTYAVGTLSSHFTMSYFRARP